MSIPYLFVGTRFLSSTLDGPAVSFSHRVVALIGIALFPGASSLSCSLSFSVFTTGPFIVSLPPSVLLVAILIISGRCSSTRSNAICWGFWFVFTGSSSLLDVSNMTRFLFGAFMTFFSSFDSFAMSRFEYFFSFFDASGRYVMVCSDSFRIRPVFRSYAPSSLNRRHPSLTKTV